MAASDCVTERELVHLDDDWSHKPGHPLRALGRAPWPRTSTLYSSFISSYVGMRRFDQDPIQPGLRLKTATHLALAQAQAEIFDKGVRVA